MFAGRIEVPRTLIRSILFSFMIGFGSQGGHTRPVPTDTVRLTDNGKGLSNPGMGWNFAYYANSKDHWRTKWGDTVDHGYDLPESFEGVTTVFFRLGWRFFEPQEGQYDWSVVENTENQWKSRGKKIAITFVVCDPSDRDPSFRSNSPPWLRTAGAKGRWIRESPTLDSLDWPNVPTTDINSWSWCPDFNDSIFLAKFDNFLGAAAARYDGKPYVDFIEIGSFGTWGEGHTHIIGGPNNAATRLKHIKLWRKHFTQSTLIVNDAFGYGSDEIDEPGPIDSAAKLGLGLADHSIQVPNGGKRSTQFAGKFWSTRPILLEHHNETPFEQEYLDYMFSYGASYMRINTPESLATLPGSLEIFRQINRHLGYRFQITEATWPRYTKAGQTANIQVKIWNDGVAPCHKGGYAALQLKAGSQVVAGFVNTSINVQSIFPDTGSGTDTLALKFPIRIPDTAAQGTVEVFLSIGEVGGQPVYELPHTGDDGSRRYRLGSLRIWNPGTGIFTDFVNPHVPQ